MRVHEREGEQREAKPATPAAPPLAHVLQLQRTAGNAAVTAMLQREPTEQEHTATPSEQHEKQQANAAKEADYEARGLDALKQLEAEEHKQGKPLRGTGTAPTGDAGSLPKWFRDLQHRVMMASTWGVVEEEAQHVLDDYASFWLERRGGKVPPNLAHLFQYVGRSSINAAAAKKGGNLAVSDGMMGGGLKPDGKPTSNWCTQATTTGMIKALEAMGFAPINFEKFVNTIAAKKMSDGTKMFIGGEQAFTEKLLPGDQVMYLFEKGQYGGHTVTAVDDLGETFTHISGNTGDAIGVGIGEAKRLKAPPSPKSGNEKFSTHKANKSQTDEEKAASTAYIRSYDFQGGVLTYSIVRYGAMLADLENLPNLAPDKQEKVLSDYGLKRTRPAPPPAAVTDG